MKNIIKSLFFLLLIAIAIYIYARFIEPKMLNVKYENLSSKYINKEAECIKILQFSDTHISDDFDIEDLKKLVEKINQEDADIVFFTGDLIDHYNNYSYKGNIEDILEVLKDINAPLGKYSVYGNHDYGGGAEKVYKQIMDSSGFITLINENVKLVDYNINIIGLDDSIFGHLDIGKIEQIIDSDFYNIVISHEPDVIDKMLHLSIDLFLSGHSHGGQVNIPFFSRDMLPALAKKYTRGIYEFENFRNTILNVNIGIGTSLIPFRFMAVPELTVITIGN